jgi:hypothetical protein
MMWVLVAIASIELLVVHFLVSLLWSRTAALVLSIITAITIGWLIWAIAAMRRLPVLVDAERLTMRVGRLKETVVPLAQVRGIRRDWDAAAIKDRSVLNLALIAYPNVIVDLILPLPGRRGIKAIAHRMDDPTAFAAAIERCSDAVKRSD